MNCIDENVLASQEARHNLFYFSNDQGREVQTLCLSSAVLS